MGRLRIIAADGKYKEIYEYLKEQFINGLNYDAVFTDN